MAHPVRILCFDAKRDFYRRLSPMFPGIYEAVIPDGVFRWNPLEPPVPWKKWAGILAAVISNACGLYGGQSSENFIYKCLVKLYEKYNTEDDEYPCLLDFLDHLYWMASTKKVATHGEERNWYSRVLNRIENFCYAFGETINCSRGHYLDDILSLHVFFDLADLKPDAMSFFMECFLTQVLWYRMCRGQRGGALRTLAVFDEAKRLLPKHRDEAQNAISNPSMLIALGREFGLGFLVADNDPSLLSNSIKSSAFTRICFNLTHGRDIAEASRALGLNPEQTDEIQRLETGHAIVRLAGRINRPFPLEISR